MKIHKHEKCPGLKINIPAAGPLRFHATGRIYNIILLLLLLWILLLAAVLCVEKKILLRIRVIFLHIIMFVYAHPTLRYRVHVQ
jgi:hypothetical protein